LHDTLLQSFQGVLMNFSAVSFLIPDRPTEAQEMLEKVIGQAREAIIEGRDAVAGLRSPTAISDNLAREIGALGEQLAADPTQAARSEFRIHVEGTVRDLAPLVRDHVHRIAGEALRNAFRHAEAGRIEVEIHYERRQFRLRVLDNGKGMEQEALHGDGRHGHFGLAGLHERAALVGGELAIRSKPGSGTEIELIIPGAVAYERSQTGHGSMSSGQGAG
jgi:signal transduction histidine kinase